MEQLQDILDLLVEFIWGPWVLIPLLLGTGVFLTVRLGGMQFWTIFHALWLALVRRDEGSQAEGDVSHYKALATALAATIGVGNIAGVATAIGIGGPGALFWMWVTGLVGMATKYSEAVLGVKYRTQDAKGEMSGGPMYYLRRGVGGNFGLILGGAFAVFGAIAAFGIGNMVQSNTVASQLNATWDIPTWLTGAVLVVATAAVVLGGIKSISNFAAAFVPLMCVLFMLGNIVVLLVFVQDLPAALALVFTDAFTGTAAAGGFAGAGILLVIQMGVARGIFSNESGLGAGGIAASAAKTEEPVRQGLVSMTQTFIDTIIMVTLTALSIIVTGAWHESGAEGAPMTSWALNQGLPGNWGAYTIALAVLVFAYTTILGWCYYGERCLEFLFGRSAVVPYRLLFVAVVYVGAVQELSVVWAFSDIANGLMALPNLLGLLLLSPVLVAESRRYFGNPDWKNPGIKVPDYRE